MSDLNPRKLSQIGKYYFFPKAEDINSEELMITDVGEYSVCMPGEADRITRILSSYFKDPSEICITDATACVGGNTISFSNIFGTVNSVEIEPDNYTCLVNNIEQYKINNITTYSSDYLDIMETLEQDIIFIDPPWGGRDYKKESVLSLKLNDVTIETLCNIIRDKTKIISFRAPFNFDYNTFLKNINYGIINMYKFKKYYIVVLINKSQGLKHY